MTDLREVLTSWAEAEQRGDAGALDQLLTDDFVGIGPVGFTLVRDGDDWRIAAIQYSFIAGTPGAPK